MGLALAFMWPPPPPSFFTGYLPSSLAFTSPEATAETASLICFSTFQLIFSLDLFVNSRLGPAKACFTLTLPCCPRPGRKLTGSPAFQWSLRFSGLPQARRWHLRRWIRSQQCPLPPPAQRHLGRSIRTEYRHCKFSLN